MNLFSDPSTLFIRKGVVKVALCMYDGGSENRTVLGLLYERVVPLSTNFDMDRQTMDLLCCSPAFDELAGHEGVPRYNPVITRTTDGRVNDRYHYTLTFERVPDPLPQVRA